MCLWYADVKTARGRNTAGHENSNQNQNLGQNVGLIMFIQAGHVIWTHQAMRRCANMPWEERRRHDDALQPPRHGNPSRVPAVHHGCSRPGSPGTERRRDEGGENQCSRSNTAPVNVQLEQRGDDHGDEEPQQKRLGPLFRKNTTRCLHTATWPWRLQMFHPEGNSSEVLISNLISIINLF